ncbi:hypothetical protein DSM14862_00225 [Sulfitobacter indolifex]|nr:hypothetical protein DSM14862_00225 [Sulfitobacter indolifex]
MIFRAVVSCSTAHVVCEFGGPDTPLWYVNQPLTP